MEQSSLHKLLPTLRSFSIKELQDGSYIHKETQEYYFDKSTYKDLERNFQGQDIFVYENVVDAPWPQLKLKSSKSYISALAVNELDSDDNPPGTEESTTSSKLVANLPERPNINTQKAIVTSEINGLDKSLLPEDFTEQADDTGPNQSLAASIEDRETMLPKEQNGVNQAAPIESAFVEDILPLSDLLALIDDYMKIPGNNLKFKF